MCDTVQIALLATVGSQRHYRVPVGWACGAVKHTSPSKDHRLDGQPKANHSGFFKIMTEITRNFVTRLIGFRQGTIDERRDGRANRLKKQFRTVRTHRAKTVEERGFR
jgi:hypothetical protein